MHVLSFLILQNFYVIIALKYVSYAVLLGIEVEITSEPEPVASKASRPLTVMFYNASFVLFDTKEFQKKIEASIKIKILIVQPYLKR